MWLPREQTKTNTIFGQLILHRIWGNIWTSFSWLPKPYSRNHIKMPLTSFLYLIIFPTKIYWPSTSCIRYSAKCQKNGLWAWKKSDYSIVQCFLSLLQNCWRNDSGGSQSSKTKQKAKKPRKGMAYVELYLHACCVCGWLLVWMSHFPGVEKGQHLWQLESSRWCCKEKSTHK